MTITSFNNQVVFSGVPLTYQYTPNGGVQTDYVTMTFTLQRAIGSSITGLSSYETVRTVSLRVYPSFLSSLLINRTYTVQLDELISSLNNGYTIYRYGQVGSLGGGVTYSYMLLGGGRLRLDSIDSTTYNTYIYVLPGGFHEAMAGRSDISDQLTFLSRYSPFMLSRGFTPRSMREQLPTVSFCRTEIQAMTEKNARLMLIGTGMSLSSDKGTLESYSYQSAVSSIELPADSDLPGLIMVSLKDGRVFMVRITDDDPADEQHLIRWTNSFGMPEALLLSGTLTRQFTPSEEGEYIEVQSGQPLNLRRRQPYELIFTLQTAGLGSDRVQALEDMLTSEDQYFRYRGEFYRAIITASVEHDLQPMQPVGISLEIRLSVQAEYALMPDSENLPVSRQVTMLEDTDGTIITDENGEMIET